MVLMFAVSIVALASACRARGTRDEPTSGTLRDAFAGLSDGRFEWLQAECDDGPLDLASIGFERTLWLQLQGGKLLLTLDTQLATKGCGQTTVWLATSTSASEFWRFEPQALVALPPAAAECGATEREAVNGTMRADGDELELVTQRSPWCRGFDARFVYRRAPPRPLTPEEIVVRYVAHFDRGDADAIAGLFEDKASLVEPFTRTGDGNYARHEGRDAVRAWYASAFTTARWHAMRLLAYEPREAGHVAADWEYMDARLREPLRGRNLFLIAEGEIYEAEVQLVSDPVPKDPATPAEPAAAAPGSQGATP
jgi:hypothetical protein